MTLPRVLFVDDDADVLGGLCKALRKHRARWDMVFAVGGPAGVEALRGDGFDVVITDMRMPELDGAAVLLHVRDHDPTTFRMILSGFSDHNATTRALPSAHQFFDKPCDLKLLSAAIDRACVLRGLFVNPALRAVADRIASVASPASSSSERDPRLTARVLRLATSAFLGIEQHARIPDPTSPEGLEKVAARALATFAQAALARPIAGFSFEDAQEHSREVAQRAQERLPDSATASEAYTAGLVHDVGKILIAVALPDEHAAISRELERPGTLRSTVERERLGTTHGEVGAYMLSQWSLPLSIIEAVAFQDSEASPATPIANALRAAHAA